LERGHAGAHGADARDEPERHEADEDGQHLAEAVEERSPGGGHARESNPGARPPPIGSPHASPRPIARPAARGLPASAPPTGARRRSGADTTAAPLATPGAGA